MSDIVSMAFLPMTISYSLWYYSIKFNIFYDYEMTYILFLEHLCDNMLETHQLVFTFKSEMKRLLKSWKTTYKINASMLKL